MPISNPRGNYQFTKGSEFYASAVRADPGFGLVRAVFDKPVPLKAGFEAIEYELRSAGRPMQALCGMELRGAAPYPTRPLFMEFNAKYIELLKSRDLLVDGRVPMTRANLAIGDGSVTEQCVYAFLYTVPSKTDRLTFATSGLADIRLSAEGTVEAVAPGNVSPDGLREKVSFVVHEVEQKLREIGVSWNLSTQIRLYTMHQIGALLCDVILPAAGPGAHHGINWHFVYPPVVGIELEIDARAVLRESVI